MPDKYFLKGSDQLESVGNGPRSVPSGMEWKMPIKPEAGARTSTWGLTLASPGYYMYLNTAWGLVYYVYAIPSTECIEP